MGEAHVSYDALVDLALDDTGECGPDVLRHVAGCGYCRGRYDEVAVGVEQVLTATPRIEPPPGFDGSVLTAMGMAPVVGRRARAAAAHPVAVAGELAPRPGRWRRISLVAAAAVLGVLTGVGGMLAWTALNGADTPGGAAVALNTADGDQVGSVTPSYLEGEPVMVVRVEEGVVGTRYECVLVLQGGRTRPVGSWVMESPHATWVVPVPPAGVDALRLVTGTGRLWSTADLAGG